MFKIGDFSRLSGISVRMLHHYDKLDILTPAHTNPSNGYRYYDTQQLQKVNYIKKLQELGFALATIKRIMSDATEDEINHFFSVRKKEIEERLEEVKIQESMIKNIPDFTTTDSAIFLYHVQKKTLPPRNVASLRKVVANYEEEGQLWQDLFIEFERQNIQYPKEALSLSIYHDDEYKEENMEIEIQCTVEGSYEDTTDIKFFQEKPITVAAVTFNGSYEQMPQVAQAVAFWMEHNGYQLDGPMVNIFHVSPAQDPNPENWITEACYQIKPV